uniref:Retrotransposon protein, putative, Ty3-gypsy subclass n=1 Tax=Tanacetum cinerariifolium TaxID=118510 RepID=A0A699HC94_TANCI|nr:retrotransposon protein, putative, Ty3-gypsy subclass [Tanacetum cinerariifolium]
MRQRHWLELLKDYDTNIQYHPGKANVVPDALRRKSGMIAGIKVEEEIIHNLEWLDIKLYVCGQHGYWASLRVKPDLISRIKEAQKEDSEIWTNVENLAEQTEFRPDEDDVQWQGTRLCVPNDATLREAPLTEAHSSPFSIHSGSTKMYHDLKQHFWWSGMKRDVATFVSRCLICQQVKIEHQRASCKFKGLAVLTPWSFQKPENMNTRSEIRRKVGSESRSGSLPSKTVANPEGELKAITTRSGIVLDGPTVTIPPPVINPEEDERVKETLTDKDLSEYTIKVPPLPQMLKALHSNKEKLQELAITPLNENCSMVILKKLPKKLGDPGKFLIPCGFSELKCKALADLGARNNLIPLFVWKKLGLPKLISTCMTLELANRAICTPDGIAKDVFIIDVKFTFPADFVIVDYESDPRVPLSWEDLSYESLPSGNPTFPSHPELTSSKVKNDIFDSEGGNVLPKKLIDLYSTKDLHPPLHVNPLSHSTTYSSSPLLEELFDDLARITFRLKYDDDLQFDVESDLKEIEFLLHQDIDSSLKDSIDQSNLANLADNFVDSMPEMFTEKHALDYSSPSIFDEYDDDFLEVESDAENVYDDPFDSKGEKIKESKLLIDELDLTCDFLPLSKYDSFISQDFSRVDAKPSANNEDKVFNPCILSQEKPFEIITRVVLDKKLAISNASLFLKDFDSPLYEPLFFKEVSRSNMLLLFSSENEEKVFKPRIHTSKKVHSSFIP